MNWKRTIPIHLALWGLIVVSGCSTTNVFRSYPSQVKPAIDSLHKGDTDGALLLVRGPTEARLEGSDRQLSLLEAGRIAFLGGNFEASREYFGRAIEDMETRDDQAVVRFEDVGAQAAALLLNDNAIPYEAAGFERIFAYQYQTLVHLFLGNVESAAIEARNALGVQQRALERHQRQIERARKQVDELSAQEDLKELDLNEALEEATAVVTPHYMVVDEVAGLVRSAFDNPLNHFLSAFVFEMQGDVDVALPSYRDALEIVPGARAFQSAVYRLADPGDRIAMEARHGRDLRDSLRENNMGPELLIVLSDGPIVQKRGLKLPVPLPRGMTTVSFPYFGQTVRPFANFCVSLDDTPMGPLDPVLSSQHYAYMEFRDRLPATITRTLIRAILTGIAVQKAGEENFLAGLAVSALGWMLENPDLRGWYTLPDHMHVFRGFIPEGEHLLRLAEGGEVFAEIPVEGRDRHVKLMYVARFQSHAFVHGTQIQKPGVLMTRAARGTQVDSPSNQKEIQP